MVYLSCGIKSINVIFSQIKRNENDLAVLLNVEWCTYHIIALTMFMIISFRTLKNSNISFAFSPIFPMITPKATKNPIKPGRQTIQ